MGTETIFVGASPVKAGQIKVKLNNPLMGTETISSALSLRVSLIGVS